MEKEVCEIKNLRKIRGVGVGVGVVVNSIVFLAAVVMLFATSVLSTLAYAQEYRLGTGDTVAIDVRNMGQKEYTIDALLVPATGRLSLPLLGNVNFLGKTTQELERIVKAGLAKGYLNRPEVTINVVKYRPFYVRGGVNQPGAFDYRFGMTVEKAIALAGGVSDRGLVNTAQLAREGDEDNTITSAGLRTAIKPGDVITIPVAEVARTDNKDDASYVYLYGEVQRPGGYEFRNGLTVEMAVALAGGFSARASKRKVSVRRIKGAKMIKHKKVPLAAPIQPGDVVTVGQSFF